MFTGSKVFPGWSWRGWGLCYARAPPHRSVHTPRLRPVWSQRYPPSGVYLVPRLAVARREVIFSFTQVTWLELQMIPSERLRYAQTHTHSVEISGPPAVILQVKWHGRINKQPHMLLTLQANKIPGINLDAQHSLKVQNTHTHGNTRLHHSRVSSNMQ